MTLIYTYSKKWLQPLLVLAFFSFFNANLQAQFNNDVAIIAIHSPVSQCGLETEVIEVTLKNFGLNPQALIPFNFSVDGVSSGVQQPFDGLYTGVLGTDSIVTVAFETTFDFSNSGIFTIAAWTDLEGDEDLSNDTTYYTAENIPVISDLPYFNNFEGADNGWSVGTDPAASADPTWAFGQPMGVDIPSAASGLNAWVTNLTGNYNNNEISYLSSPCMNFELLTDDPIISFAINYDTETNFDGCWLEGSMDGGVTWAKVGAIGQGINWYNFNNTNQGLGDCWAGNSGGWLSAELTLDGFAGQEAVRFRFVFDSDGSVNGFDGIGIDDVFLSIPLAADLGVATMTSESMALCGDAMDHVIIDIRNYGTDVQTGFDVSYQIDNEPVVTENVGALSLNPGEIASYTFAAAFNSNVFNEVLEITSWTSLVGELNLINDTTIYNLATLIPDYLPIVTDFESTAIPDGWVADGIVGNGHNNVSYALYDNLYSGDPTFEVTSNILGPINPGDSLTFDYRYTEWSTGTTALNLGAGDELNVQVSTDCGETFTTIFTIDQNNHTPIVTMTNRTVDLDAYANEYIQLRFFATWGTDDYWLDLDNINIIGCPINFGVQSTVASASNGGSSDGSITINPTQGQDPYTFIWSNGESTNMIDNLSPGIYTVSMTDANGCTDVVDVEVLECPENFGFSIENNGVTNTGAMDGMITITPTSGTGPYTYNWDNGMTASTISNLTEGDYTVTVTDANGCMDVTTVSVGIGVGIEDVSLLRKVKVTPNPTTGMAVLEMSFNSFIDLNVEVVNVVGQTVFEAQAINTQEQVLELDLSNYSSGMYFIRLSMNNQNHIEKLIKL